MPRAAGLRSGKDDSDMCSSEILALFDKKIRNIDKRKKHLEELRASGDDQSLTEQQREALSKYDEVCANHLFALELRERCVELIREATLRKSTTNRHWKVDCSTQTDSLQVEHKCEQVDTSLSAHIELDAMQMQHAFELFRVSQQQQQLQQQQLLASATNQLILGALGPPRQPLLHSAVQDGLAAGRTSPADSKVAAARPPGVMTFPSAEEALRAAGLTPSGNFTFLQPVPDPITIDAGPGLGFNPASGSGPSPSTLLSCGPRAVVVPSVSGPSSGIGVIADPLSGSEPVTGRLAPGPRPRPDLGSASGLVSLAAQDENASERDDGWNDGWTRRPQRSQRGRGRANIHRYRRISNWRPSEHTITPQPAVNYYLTGETRKAVESWLESVAVANNTQATTMMSDRSPIDTPSSPVQQSTTNPIPRVAEYSATVDSEWD